MFVSFDYNNYESDLMNNRLTYLDGLWNNESPQFVLQRNSNNLDPDKSIYGKKMEKEIHNTTRFIQDIDRQIKDTRKKIEMYNNGGKFTVQRATEMENVLQGYYKMKLDAIKVRSGFEREIDKARKEDLKLLKDLNGDTSAVNVGNNIGTSSGDFMANLFAGGVDGFFHQTQPPINNQGTVSTTVSKTYTAPAPTQQINPEPIVINDKKEITPEVVKEVLETPSDSPSPMLQAVLATPHGDVIPKYTKNALGKEVPVYTEEDEGLDDFVEGDLFTNGKLAYENMQLSTNPDIKKVFKHNEKLGMGWLAFYDMKNNVEVKGKGTLYNVEQLYPYTIDKENNLVTTVLEENYDLVITDEIPSQRVQDEYNRLKNIYSNKTE